MMLFQCRRVGALLLSTILLTGCGTPLVKTDIPATWPKHQKQVLRQTHWEAHGRCAVILEQGHSATAAFEWHQAPETYSLSFSGPFQGPVQIHGQPGHVSIAHAKEKNHAVSGEALLEALTGWTLPVSSLAYWIRGIPDPQSPYALTGFYADGRLATFEQNQWKIEIQTFKNNGYPERVMMRHPSMKVKWLIRQWQT